MDALVQTYPLKPIRLVVGFSPGGAADVTARLVGQKLSEEIGQPVIVENRTGASGLIANERVAGSPPDGYTLVMVSSAAAIMPAPHSKLPYDVEREWDCRRRQRAASRRRKPRLRPAGQYALDLRRH